MIKKTDNEISFPNNRSSSLLLRNLRMLDHQRSSEILVEPVPLSYIDIKQPALSPQLMNINHSTLKKSLTSSIVAEKKFSPCPIKVLNEIETQMVVPFEFRRLRIEKPDHRSKFLDDDPRDKVPDLSTAVYERRSDPEGVRFCRTCRDGKFKYKKFIYLINLSFLGFWTQLTICDTVRCDAELLRANPRLVTEWGEIKALDGGVLYAPSSVYAIYAFAFGPHCKRCESNGQWSRYALSELCSGIKFFGHPTTMKAQSSAKFAKLKQMTTLSSTKPTNKKQ
jgi:hypothetical protein